MADTPSSPLTPPSPTSPHSESPNSSLVEDTSPPSSPNNEPPKKIRASWEVKSTFGQPSRATRSLWGRTDQDVTYPKVPISSGIHRDGTQKASEHEVDRFNQAPTSEACTGPPSTGQAPVDQVTDQSEVSMTSDSEDISSVSASSVSTCQSIREEDDCGVVGSDSEVEVQHDLIISNLGGIAVCSDSDSASDSEDDREDVGSLKLYVGCEKSVDEAVYDLLNDYFEHSESHSSLKSHLQTFLKYLPKPNNMPKNVYRLFKHLENLDPTFKESSHFYCSQCLLYLEDEDAPCEACGSDSKKLFYSFDVRNQIKHFLENCGLAEQMDKIIQARNSPCINPGCIRDIPDGSEYTRLNVSGYSVTLLWYTDGVSISRSSGNQLSPIQYMICELPPQVRSLYIGVAGVWCDAKKPVMNTFLIPFVGSLVNIRDEKGFAWKHPKTGYQCSSDVKAPLACADAPARADLQGLQGHNALFACNSCEQKKVKIPLTNAEEEARAAGLNVRIKRGFVGAGDSVNLRNDGRMRRQARRALRIKQPVKGVKGPSCVQNIPELDMSTFTYAEYMHGVCLGVVRQFMRLWFDVLGPWNIRVHLDAIDEFVGNVKPTCDVNRILHCASDFFRWKASECRQWLLFVSLVALEDFLPDKYFQHWMLLVKSIFLLLQTEITQSDVSTAELMLKVFVRDVATLYRGEDCVYNVHQLLHLPLYVKRWGPLWATSAFGFEGYNGILRQMIHGSKNPGKELVNSLRRAHCMNILKNKVVTRSNCEAADLKPLLYNRVNFSRLSDDDRNFFLTERTLSSLVGCVHIYTRVKMRRETFTSLLYAAEKLRNNYTVCYRINDRRVGYGEIKCYVQLPNDHILVYIYVLHVQHSKMLYHTETRAKVSHILPISESIERIVFSLDNILFKVMRVGGYVCQVPNKYEKNL